MQTSSCELMVLSAAEYETRAVKYLAQSRQACPKNLSCFCKMKLSWILYFSFFSLSAFDCRVGFSSDTDASSVLGCWQRKFGLPDSSHSLTVRLFLSSFNGLITQETVSALRSCYIGLYLIHLSFQWSISSVLSSLFSPSAFSPLLCCFSLTPSPVNW